MDISFRIARSKASDVAGEGSPPQTVLKVSARVEKSVPHYRGDNEFSILAGGTFTFKTVSPVQICSGLKDRGCPARPSGLNPPGLVGTELQRIAAGAGCWRKSVEEGLRGSGGTAIFQMAHIHANLARISLRRNPFFYGRTPQT